MHYTGAESLAITWAFTTLMIIVWLLRLYTRLWLARNYGWEDLFISLAALSSIGLSICIQEQVRNGMGRHVWTLSEDQTVSLLKAFYGSLTVYYLALMFCKVSIILQYLRIFTLRGFRIAAFVTLSVVSVYGAWTVFSSIFICWPIQFFWNNQIKGGHCLNKFAVWFTNAGFNILSDFTIVILPLSSIRGLNLPRRQKRLLVGVFGLAGFVCIVSILRLSSLLQISESKDPTYDNGPAATWSSIEANVGITCACLPPLRPLISHFAPALLRGTRHGTKYNTAGWGSNGRYDSNLSRRVNHTPLSSSRRKSGEGYSSGGQSRICDASNDREEEIIGLKDVLGVYTTSAPSIGVQPATVVSTSPPSRTFSLGISAEANKIQRPKPVAAPGERGGAIAPTARPRGNSSDRPRTPEWNDIQVTTSMHQSVETLLGEEKSDDRRGRPSTESPPS